MSQEHNEDQRLEENLNNRLQQIENARDEKALKVVVISLVFSGLFFLASLMIPTYFHLLGIGVFVGLFCGLAAALSAVARKLL